MGLPKENIKIQVVALSVLTTVLVNLIFYRQSIPISLLKKEGPSVPSPSPALPALPSVVPASQNEIILKELNSLRQDMVSSLNEIKNNQDKSQPLPTVDPNLVGGMVKIVSEQWEEVDVFEKALASSRIIGQLSFGNIYFYREKKDGWYQVELSLDKSGYVQSQFLKEFP